jgi:hypothetical protein
MSNAGFNEAEFEKEKAENEAQWAKIVQHFEQIIRKLEARALEMAKDHDRQLRKAEKRLAYYESVFCYDHGPVLALSTSVNVRQVATEKVVEVMEERDRLRKDKARVDLIEAQMATTITMGEMPNGTKRFTVEILPWNTETIYGSGLSFRAALDDAMEED